MINDASLPHSAVDAPQASQQQPTALLHTDDERFSKKMNGKVKFILIVFLLCFVIIAVRLFLIQISYGDYYRTIARKQYESKVTLAAERGNIYDRKHRLIATTVQKLSVAADPKMLERPSEVARVLASVTGKSAEEYLAKLRGVSSSFVWLERTIDSPASILTTKLDSLTDEGLIKTREPRRSFAYGALASQVLGFTDSENKGASGIELGWDSVLCGKAGSMMLQRDGRGRKRPSLDFAAVEAKTGKSLVLTLDIDVQSIVESELQQGIQATESESGMVVAMKPSTGEILAMASYPTYNPNILSTATPEVTRNRCFTDMYEPGSTFKLVTAAALLNEGRVKPDETVNGSPENQRVLIPDVHPVGVTTFAHAVEMSSNIVMMNTILRLSNAKFYKYVRDFGFGIYSGIEVPGEVRGIVKRPHEFDATTKMYMATGYQLAATPLQIVTAYATIANGGVMMKPYIVQRIVDEHGDDVQVFEQQKVRRVVSEETAQQITKIFCGVAERGTGEQARIPGMSIAGKTGTAQKLRDGRYSKEDYTASFAGFFPSEKPEIVLLVMLHKPRKGTSGGTVAAPIFQKIAQKLVSSGLISPGTNGQPVKQVKAENDDKPSEENAAAMPNFVPDLRGLPYNDALEAAKNAGFKVRANIAGGVVQSQKPAAGMAAKTGAEIRVTTTQPDITVDALPNTTIPDVRGMALRRALTLLHAANIKTKVIGQGGIVQKQEFKDGKEPLCILDCRK